MFAGEAEWDRIRKRAFFTAVRGKVLSPFQSLKSKRCPVVFTFESVCFSLTVRIRMRASSGQWRTLCQLARSCPIITSRQSYKNGVKEFTLDNLVSFILSVLVTRSTLISFPGSHSSRFQVKTIWVPLILKSPRREASSPLWTNRKSSLIMQGEVKLLGQSLSRE